MKQAVILAAGKGSRLGESLGFKPKCLQEIEDVVLLDHTIANLMNQNFQQIFIIVGYEKELIVEHLLIRKYDNIICIENSDFDAFGTMHSLSLATSQIDVGTFVFDADLIWDKRVLEIITNQVTDMTVCVEHSGSNDECVPTFDNGAFIDFRKNAEVKVFPEMMGISYITKSTLESMNLINSKFANNLSYEAALGRVVSENKIPFSFLYIPNLLWSDLVNNFDLIRMRDVIKKLNSL